MSVMTQTAIGHVTSTSTSGKYLNPEMIDLSEIYSKRTPLDLLIETCNNIGRDAGSQQTSAKERRPRTSLRGYAYHMHQSPSTTKQQGTRLGDADTGNVLVPDGYPAFQDNKGSRSVEEEEVVRRNQSAGENTIDQDGPEDLRLWSNRQSPDGSSMLNSPDGSCRKSPSGDSLSSLSPSSYPSPTLPDGSPYPRFSRDPEEVKLSLAESLRDGDIIPTSHPLGIDTGFLLHQYLELQSMIQLAILQERANQVRQLTFEKPLSAFSSPIMTAADLSPESRVIYGLSDIAACHPLISKIQQDELLRSLSSGLSLDGLLPPGLSYFGEASPFRGPRPLPPFYHQHLAAKTGLVADGFLPGLFQSRPEEMLFGNSSLLFAKHLELLSHLSESPLSRPLPPYDVSPVTRGYTPDRFVESSQRLTPENHREMQSPSRRHSRKSPGERSVQRHHPYGRPESPSTRSPTSSKSSSSFRQHSAFQDPVHLS